MSSMSTMTTCLGAPCGALTSNLGGGFTLRASSSLYVGDFGSAIGKTVRSSLSCAAAVVPAMLSTILKQAIRFICSPFY